MEPISLSLIAIGATGMALRRASREEDVVEFPPQRADAEAHASILSRLARCRLVPRKLTEPGRRSLALSLARFVAVHGLQLNMQTSLAALFESQGKDSSAIDVALRERRAEFVICDALGTPICGIETQGRPSAAGTIDSVQRQAFDQAGVPLVILRAQADWEENRIRLLEALGLAPELAN